MAMVCFSSKLFSLVLCVELYHYYCFLGPKVIFELFSDHGALPVQYEATSLHSTTFLSEVTL